MHVLRMCTDNTAQNMHPIEPILLLHIIELIVVRKKERHKQRQKAKKLQSEERKRPHA
jgi:hypothetical protein